MKDNLTPEQIDMLFKELRTRAEMKDVNPELYSRKGKEAASSLKEAVKQQPEDVKAAKKIGEKVRPKLSLVPNLPPTDIIPEASDDVFDVMASELEKPTVESTEEVSEKALTDSAKSSIMKGAKKGIPGPIKNATKAGILSIAAELAFPEEAGENIEGSPEEVIENPNMPQKLRIDAMKKVREKYLKPKDE